VQCSAVQCSAVQCSAVQCSAVQCSDAGACDARVYGRAALSPSAGSCHICTGTGLTPATSALGLDCACADHHGAQVGDKWQLEESIRSIQDAIREQASTRPRPTSVPFPDNSVQPLTLPHILRSSTSCRCRCRLCAPCVRARTTRVALHVGVRRVIHGAGRTGASCRQRRTSSGGSSSSVA
jgi:hypothetical protein